MTGTYRFQNGFSGITDMPVEFQKNRDYNLIGLKNLYCFLDDILIVSKRSKDHKQYVFNCLKSLDEENLRTKLRKCQFAKLEIDWLGFHFPQAFILPIKSKTSAILSLEAPKRVKKLRSFLRSVHYISKFIPSFAQISHPLRPLLKKLTKFIWTETNENCFFEITNRIAIAANNCHNNPQLDAGVKCYASLPGSVMPLNK